MERGRIANSLCVNMVKPCLRVKNLYYHGSIFLILVLCICCITIWKGHRNETYIMRSESLIQRDALSDKCKTGDEFPEYLTRVNKSLLDGRSSALLLPSVEFVRGVLLYMPNDTGDFYPKQLRWFYQSFLEMLKAQPINWRTDIIVVMVEWIPLCGELNFTKFPRSSSLEPSMGRCISGYKTDHLREFYDYDMVKSMDIVRWDGYRPEQYDWMLRSDLDTFLTPAFSKWKPSNMITGTGGYIQGDHLLTFHRLERVAQNLGLKSAKIRNIGSTWYGPVRLMQRAASLCVAAMAHLKKHEFSQFQKGPKIGTDGWPEWHYGVLLLYGGHTAINHIANFTKITVGSKMLDYSTTSRVPWIGHAHLHSWHTDEKFSKFAFNLGHYDNVTLDSLNIKLCRDYAMYMAIKGNPVN